MFKHNKCNNAIESIKKELKESKKACKKVEVLVNRLNLRVKDLEDLLNEYLNIKKKSAYSIVTDGKASFFSYDKNGEIIKDKVINND